MSKEFDVRRIWRAAGLSCLIGVGVTATFWLDSARSVYPYSERIKLIEGTPVYVQIPENLRTNELWIAFEDPSGKLLTCDEINELNFSWKISDSNKNNLARKIVHMPKNSNPNDTSNSKDYSCSSFEKKDNIRIGFFLPDNGNNTKYYLHLSTFRKKELPTKLTALITGSSPFGLSVAYGYNNMAICEIIGTFLLVTGIFCFLVDFGLMLRAKRSKN